MPALPWMKWYPQDWLSDPALTMCSAATRGIWADALFAMKLNNSYYLTGTVPMLARLCRCSESEMEAALLELHSTNAAAITEQNGNKTITSRRLKREHEISTIRSIAGSKSKQNRSKSQTKRVTNSASASVSASEYASVSGSDADKNCVPDSPGQSGTPASVSESGSASDSAQGESKRGKLRKYGEFGKVKLADKEYSKLREVHGKKKADKGIAALDAWLERTGKHRKNHYACLSADSWVWEKATDNGGKPGHKATMFELKASLDETERQWERCKASGKVDTDQGRNLRKRLKMLREQIGSYVDWK